MVSSYKYDSNISKAITWLRFPLIFFIIMLHCYSVQKLRGDHDVYFKTIYPFALWLGETGVPGFFFISGYLFYLSKKTFLQKLRTRVKTLLVPYLLWNLALLIIYVIAYIIGYPQDINGKNIAVYNIIDYLRLFWDRGSYDNGNFVPLLCPLWYIRNLIIMSIISPLVYYLIRYVREAFIIAITIWWMMTYDNAFIPQTILFFSFGAYFSIFHINPLQIVDSQKGLFLFCFFIFAISDILCHITSGTIINLQIHRFSLIFNIFALLLLADYCIKHQNTNQELSNTAFILFCVHYPIVVLLRKICIIKFADAIDIVHILLYFICILLSTLLSLLFYHILDRFFPKIKSIVSGNRS